jgi:hypothetical protein
MNVFTTVAHDIVNEAKAFKAWLLKAMEDAPMIIKKIEADTPEVEALTSLVCPGAAAVEHTALNVLTVVANAIHDVKDVATAKGLNVNFDQALINDVKALIPALEAFQQSKSSKVTNGLSR